MSVALLVLIFAAGLTAGYVAALPGFTGRGGSAAGRPHPTLRRASNGVGPALYDWRLDPAVAHCDACGDRGHIITLGRVVRCPCGNRAAS